MQNIPPGLILVKDLTDRLPAERERILRHEIAIREREIAQCKGIRRVLHLQIWSSLRTVFLVGALIFVLLFALSQLSALSRWIKEIRGLNINLPAIPGLWKGGRLSSSSVIPSPEFAETLSNLPNFDLTTIGIITLFAILILLAWKGYAAYRLQVQSKTLKEAEKNLREEIEELKKMSSDRKTKLDNQAETS